MLIPILLGTVAVVGGVAALASSSSDEPSSPRFIRARVSPDNAVQNDIDSVIASADEFSRSLEKYAAPPGAPREELAAMAERARAAKAAEEKRVKKEIDDRFDQAALAASTYAAYTGVGVIAIPFIYAGSYLGRWAAKAQLAMIKFFVGGAADGWSADWVRNTEGEMKWFVDHGIPFHQFDPKKQVSPMGYVNGGGGTTCHVDAGGLCGMRKQFSEKLPAELRPDAFDAFLRIKNHVMDNPYCVALYALSASFDYDWTLSAFAVSSSLLDWFAKNPKTTAAQWAWVPLEGRTRGDNLQFFHMLVAAIATTTAQDTDLPFELWLDAISATWEGWNEGICHSEGCSSRDIVPNGVDPGVNGAAYAHRAAFAFVNEYRKSAGLPVIA